MDLWCLVRRKRAADNGDDSGVSSTTNNAGGLYISTDRITSPDRADPPPDQPLHEGATFPTPNNISEQMANDLCRGAIQNSELYDRCLNYTTTDTEHYTTSCVEDIKVTCIVCSSRIFISTKHITTTY